MRYQTNFGMLIAVCKIQRCDAGFVETGGDHKSEIWTCPLKRLLNLIL